MRAWLLSRFNAVDIAVFGLVLTVARIALFPDNYDPDVPVWEVRVSVGYMIVGGIWVIVSNPSPRWQRVTAWACVAAATAIAALVVGDRSDILLASLAVAALSQAWKASRGEEVYRE